MYSVETHSGPPLCKINIEDLVQIQSALKGDELGLTHQDVVYFLIIDGFPFVFGW